MRTLVLNAGYEPLAIVSFKRALVLVMNDKATVIERVEDDPVWGSHGVYDRPAVIVLSRYVRIPASRRVPVTRRESFAATITAAATAARRRRPSTT